MKKIIEAYKKAGEFCELMSKYEKSGFFYAEAMMTEEFREFENDEKKKNKSHPKIMIIGTLFYLARHPRKMISAQKYYGSGFGKPCPIKARRIGEK